jgi:hypothetical protein
MSAPVAGLSRGQWMILAVAALVIAGVALAGLATRDSSKAGWALDPKTGCKVWDEVLDPNETVSWSEPCANGLAEGKGTVQWFIKGKAQERYEGEMHAGKMSGRGVLSFPNGMRYEGGFKDNNFDGMGKLRFANGDVYEGSFVDDDRSGQGTFTMASGGSYVGRWKEDMPHGKGVLKRADGKIYDGDWKMGCFSHDGVKTALVALPKDCGIY